VLTDMELDKERQHHHHHRQQQQQQLQQVLGGQWEPMVNGNKAHHQHNGDDLDRMMDWVKGKVDPLNKGSGDVNKKAADATKDLDKLKGEVDLLENKTDPLDDAIKKAGGNRKALEDDLRKAIKDLEDTWKNS